MDASSDPGENQFFDALEEIAEVSDSIPDFSGNFSSNSDSSGCNSLLSCNQFDVWIRIPDSVENRRTKFFNWLGLDVDKISGDDTEYSSGFEEEVDRITNSSGAAVKDTSLEFKFSLSRPCISCWPTDNSEFCKNLISTETFVSRIVNQDEGIENNVDQNRKLHPDISVTVEQPGCSSSSSSSSREFSPIESMALSHSVGSTNRVKRWWLSRLRSFTCVVEGGEEPPTYDSASGTSFQRVKVHPFKKQSKELSALYYGQNIQAHKGAILTMKFSPDGQFLASAGEDRIVRVWQVVEEERSNEHDIPDIDPSCVYFTMNHLSELNPLSSNKEKNGKLRRTSDSACVILPPKVFRILEKPLHEFYGHTSEILDLSWSRNNCLLSSSGDKTVRLWQIGMDHCLQVFPHNNYVTCVQFNPVNEDEFISGSIDGKVRIWEISRGKVVNWTEIKDIITAVCYSPNGQGGIIGLITGSCRFFSIADNQLQLDAPIFMHGKKKSSGKRITGFQFFPQDPSKVMVCSADSQIRIIQGVNVVGKYKGLRSTGTYCSAFFTSDGEHIVSASEDSSVYMWNCTVQDYGERSQVKKIKSCERFLSNASVALPWPGLQNESVGNRWRSSVFSGLTHGARSLFSPARFSCGQELFLESYYPKGSALWPEEKLLGPNPMGMKSSIHKSEYKFLRACQNRSDSNAWGLVIVTAGWDGRIRSFHNCGLPVPH